MIQDIWNALRVYIEDRLSSPLLTAFLFAWSIFNFKFFLVVFSGETFIEKMALLEQFVFPTFEAKLYKGLICPLSIALIYVLVYPFIDRLIFSAWRWHQHKLLKVRQQRDLERPVSEDDRVALLLYIQKLKTAHNEDQRGLATVSDQQRIRISELEARIAEFEKTKQPPPPDTPQTEKPVEPNLSPPITLENLEKYVLTTFPNKKNDKKLLEIILNDLEGLGFQTIEDINSAVRKAYPFVSEYETIQPSMFTKGGDYISKSLGFVNEKFLERHQFTNQTRETIKSFQPPTHANPRIRGRPGYALPKEAETTDITSLSFEGLGNLIIQNAKAIRSEIQRSNLTQMADHDKVNRFISNFMPKIVWLYGEAKRRGLHDTTLEQLTNDPRAQISNHRHVLNYADQMEKFGSDVKIRSY